MVIRCADKASQDKAVALLAEKTKKSAVKSKTVQKGHIEINMEIRLDGDDTDFVNELADIEGVDSAVLVSYNGDYMG